MYWTAWSTIAALILYFWVSIAVAKARKTYQIPAPEMNGPTPFLSVLRVQANTVEQLVLFLPALWMCAYFFSDAWAAAGGAVWTVGRFIYALGYYRDPKKRALGFSIAIAASFTLIGATVWSLLTAG